MDCISAHGASRPAKTSLHSSKVRRPNSSSRARYKPPRFAPDLHRRKARIVRKIVPSQDSTEIRPIAVRLQEDELYVTSILGPVGADQRDHESAPSAGGHRRVPPRAANRSDDIVHIAVANSETSTTEPRPVRVRLSNAAEIPNASAMAPLRSPMAPHWPIGWSRSAGVSMCATPARAQYAEAVIPRMIGIGPRVPYPFPLA